MNQSTEKNQNKKNNYILIILIVAIIAIIVGVVLFVLPKNSPKKEVEEKTLESNVISDYVEIKNPPEVFKDHSVGDSYYGYYFDEGEGLQYNSCTAVITISQMKKIEEELNIYKDRAKIDTVSINNIDWNHFALEETVPDEETHQEIIVRYHIYMATIKGKVIVVNVGYNGDNSGKCFDYEEDFMKSVSITK